MLVSSFATENPKEQLEYAIIRIKELENEIRKLQDKLNPKTIKEKIEEFGQFINYEPLKEN